MIFNQLNTAKRAKCSFMVASLALAMSPHAWADCSYTITNNWGSGFTGEITVTNNTNQTINGWSVNWKDSATITNSWNANLSGSNPYTATSMGWNGTLAPNASASFGFQGAGNASVAQVNGSLCGPATPSTSSKAPSSIIASATPASSAAASSTPASSKPVLSSAVPSSKPLASSSSSAPNNSVLILQEEQAGFCSVDGSIDSNNSGFTGNGFANTDNSQGTAIKWAVNASNSSSYTLSIRFANGGTSNRNGSLVINGGSNGNYTVELPSTGSWTNWQTISIDVDLVQGNNSLQLTALTTDGLANIDSLTTQGPQASAGTCGAVASSAVASSKATASSAPASSKASSSTATGGTADCNSINNQPIITVAADGSGQFKTVQAALDSISSSNKTQTQLRIKPGTYREKLEVTKSFVTFCGQLGKETSTVLTYNDGASTIGSNGAAIGTSGSGSVTIKANDISVENITIENTRGQGTQAVALYARGDRLQFRNCRLLGFQDTLYVNGGTQYYRNCHIEGSVDFIFGAATAVFENNTIHSVASGTSLTAPSTAQGTTYGIVFLGGKVTAVSSITNGSVALGRNWGAYGAATYIRTDLGQHISPVGWVKMSSNTLDTARFSEYQTTGAGANPSARAPQASQLSSSQAAAYTVSNIFGSWAPSFSK